MRILVAAALTAAATMLSPAVRAEQSEARTRCFAREGVSIEQKLDACTAVIESGQETPRGLIAVFNARGNARLDNRDFDRAIDDYSEAIRLNPKDPSYYNNRGNAWHARGDNDRAIADFNEAIRLNPANAAYYNNRRDAWLAEGDLARAIADANQATRLGANNPN